MTDLPTLEAAMALADQDCPLPQLAGPALKVLRNQLQNAEDALFDLLIEAARPNGNARHGHARHADYSVSVYFERGSIGSAVLIRHERGSLHVSGERVVFASSRELDGPKRDSATPADRMDRLRSSQWRQHLREELMDALPHSLAEERTAASPEGISIGAILEVEAAAQQGATTCWCETCHPTHRYMHMILCPTCGNKRCPHAHDHRNACTGSNAVGQPGSSWEHVKPAAPPAEDC